MKLHTKIFLGLVLGIVAGILFREKVMIIEPVGTVFLHLITMIVIPLVFVSLMLGTASLGDVRKLGRIGAKTAVYFVITTVIAICIGLFLANTVNPGKGLPDTAKAKLLKDYEAKAQAGIQRLEEKPSVLEILINIVPTNPVAAFVEGNMLQIIFMALLFGIVLTMIPADKSAMLIKILDALNDIFIQMVHVVMKLAPYGVLALSAVVVGRFGTDILLTLLKYCLAVICGLTFYAVTFNSLAVSLLGRMNPLNFFRGAKEAIIIAFSTSSSMATLPVAMESVEHMGVSREYSSFVIPLGSTINMDGTALYQGVSAVFIAQIYGIGLGLTGQVIIVLMALLSSIGAAGVPMAGIIALAIVLKQLGIPLEGIALIFGVERLLDMTRTSVNVIGNMACSVVIHELEENTKRRRASSETDVE
ncbi:MAG: dicarboxylate/amino acid:cation symporter [Candidatus Aminicenantes bacterium]|nr:dicarboxylate/amino acid:cation symporter [Candidatus Aminicenantes bacterium]